MITIGIVTSRAEPSTEVSHSPRNGLRQRASSLVPGGGWAARPCHSARGDPYPASSDGSVRRFSSDGGVGLAGGGVVMAAVSPQAWVSISARENFSRRWVRSPVGQDHTVHHD